MKQITEKEIAREISELINKKVNDLKQDDEKWKNQYDSVLQELESEIKLTEELLEDFTESKLSINLIEQEGYLRCLRTMVNRFRDWERWNDL
jgi:CRISPR/Cas system CMR-associated protein Cmr5 small subunit